MSHSPPASDPQLSPEHVRVLHTIESTYQRFQSSPDYLAAINHLSELRAQIDVVSDPVTRGTLYRGCDRIENYLSALDVENDPLPGLDQTQSVELDTSSYPGNVLYVLLGMKQTLKTEAN